MKKQNINGEVIISFDDYQELKEYAGKKVNAKGNLFKRSFFVGNEWIRFHKDGLHKISNGYTAVISVYK